MNYNTDVAVMSKPVPLRKVVSKVTAEENEDDRLRAHLAASEVQRLTDSFAP